jgi:hypothetical protein
MQTEIITAERIRLAGLAAILAGVIHVAYLVLITAVFPIGPDGLFPIGTLAFRLDGLVAVIILGLYLLGLVGLHANKRAAYDPARYHVRGGDRDRRCWVRSRRCR